MFMCVFLAFDTLKCITTLLFGDNSHTNIRIVVKNDDFIVVDKPFDLVLNSDDPERDSVFKRLAEKYPHEADFRKYRHGFAVVHRLDYSTSGLVAVALNSKAASAAAKAFEARKVDKVYVAIVRGIVSADKIRISRCVGIDPDDESGIRMKTGGGGKRAKKAETELLVVGRGVLKSDGFPVTKVLLNPRSGRRHQLRVHCSSLGHTIVGDFVYSRKKDLKPERMFLHALQLDIRTDLINARTKDPFEDVMIYSGLPAFRLNEQSSLMKCFLSNQVPDCTLAAINDFA